MGSESVSVENFAGSVPGTGGRTPATARNGEASTSGELAHASARVSGRGTNAAAAPNHCQTLHQSRTSQGGLAICRCGSISGVRCTGDHDCLSQTAMPGHTLYDWKLGSEIIWRAVSADQVSVDLSLAERRTDEITTVSEDAGNLGKARTNSTRSWIDSKPKRIRRMPNRSTMPWKLTNRPCRRRASRTASWTRWCTAKATRSPDPIHILK